MTKDDEHHKSRPISPEMGRCSLCQRWASIPPDMIGRATCGGCGGAMVEVDMRKHVDSIPKATPEKPPTK